MAQELLIDEQFGPADGEFFRNEPDEIKAIDVIAGLQIGDEGKGAFVDRQLRRAEYDIVARYGGGPNAGHTIAKADGSIIKFHGMPSGMVDERIKNVIGNGALVDPVKLVAEIDYLAAEEGIEVTAERLLISSAAHLILPHHIVRDTLREAGEDSQGSTKSGIAFAAADKYERIGHQAASIKNNADGLFRTIVDNLDEIKDRATEEELALILKTLEEIAGSTSHVVVAERTVTASKLLSDFITDTSRFLKNAIRRDGARVLAEGAQAYWLDPNHGMYPLSTSTGTTAMSVSDGLGIPAHYINDVFLVAKAIPSNVGGDTFVTQISKTEEAELLERIHGPEDATDAERGTTTGRRRDLGHFDLPQIRRAITSNSDKAHAKLVLTKLDWVARYGNRYGGDIPICTSYTRKGTRLLEAPDAAYKLRQSTPNYQMVRGWTDDISGARKFKDLPRTAQDYIKFIEDGVGREVVAVGVGQLPDQVIFR